MTFTKRMQFPSSWKSLLHFNFPVPYETGDAKKDDIGKIDVLDFSSYVAIKAKQIDFAQESLNKTKIKGKYYRVYKK